MLTDINLMIRCNERQIIKLNFLSNFSAIRYLVSQPVQYHKCESVTYVTVVCKQQHL